MYDGKPMTPELKAILDRIFLGDSPDFEAIGELHAYRAIANSPSITLNDLPEHIEVVESIVEIPGTNFGEYESTIETHFVCKCCRQDVSIYDM